MDYNDLISKKAVDKNQRELGIIIKIEKLPHILHKRIVHHLIIKTKVKKEEVSIPIAVSEITAVKNNVVHLKISEKYFLEEAKRQIILQKERKKYKAFVNTSSNWHETAVADRRPQQRRR